MVHSISVLKEDAMAFKCLFLVLTSVLGLSHCAFVDTLNKCALDNKECQKELLQKILIDIAESGVPELDIPPTDPAVMKDMDISIPDVVNMKLVEAKVKGVKDCIIHKFSVNIKRLHATLELTCDVTVKGKYDIISAGNEMIKNILGGDIHGKGTGKVKIEKILLKIIFPFIVEKRGDDVFLKIDVDKQKHTFELPAKVTFTADKIFVGDKDASKEAVALLNQNWKEASTSFGQHFLDLAMRVVYNFVQKFFNNVPTKYYLLDDLSSYAH